MLFINGLQADLDVYDVFSLLDTLLGEAKIMEGLYSLGIQVRKNTCYFFLYKILMCI